MIKYLVLSLTAILAAAQFEEVAIDSGYMQLYKLYSNSIASMSEGVFEYSVALFYSEFYQPHSELFNEFMTKLKPALNKDYDYTGEHKIQFYI